MSYWEIQAERHCAVFNPGEVCGIMVNVRFPGREGIERPVSENDEKRRVRWNG